MKRFIVLSIIVSLVFISCSPVPYSKLNSENREKYIEYLSMENISSTNGAFSGSPLSYNVLKGKNSLADYDYKIVRIKTYWFTYYSGDKSRFINEYFPNADIILAYNGIFYVGYKKN